MDPTPVHDRHNPDLLKAIPPDAQRIIEIGCSSGALARAFKTTSPQSHWLGVDMAPQYVALAQRFCDSTLVANLDDCGADFYQTHRDRDCWVFGDTLEHCKDPWAILGQIRQVIPAHGCVAVCIPNAQHWSVLVRLATGDFRYEASGLLDQTHLRWFTRKTLIALFHGQGFKIVTMAPRIFAEPQREKYLPLIGDLAQLAGMDRAQAEKDCVPLQYVLRAVPV